MKKYLLVSAILLCLGSVFVVGCGSGRLDPAPTIRASPWSWQRGWLVGRPCAPPCWEGITPGKTSGEEALQLLNKMAFVRDVKFDRLIGQSDRGQIQWDLKNGFPGGMIVFDTTQSGEPVTGIQITYSETFKLSEIIDRFGEPTYVIAAAYRAPLPEKRIEHRLYLVFLEHGFAVEALAAPELVSGEIQVTGPFYFVPSLQGFEEFNSGLTQFLVPWEGFQSFQFYCRDGEEGRACRGEP